MMKYIARFILWICGWRVVKDFPFEYKKCIVIEAPHTSNWDFVIGWLAFKTMNIPVKFLIKKDWFAGIMGPPLRALGGIPVDRDKKNNMVDQIVRLFEENESLYITITPEGTRKRVEQWKRGFYYIALHAKVPVILGYLDYKKKEGGVGGVFFPSGNIHEDWPKIEAFYRDKNARHPERFNLS